MFFVVFSGVWAWNGPILHIPVGNGVVVHYTNGCRRWLMIYCLFYVICVIFEIFVFGYVPCVLSIFCDFGGVVVPAGVLRWQNGSQQC